LTECSNIDAIQSQRTLLHRIFARHAAPLLNQALLLHRSCVPISGTVARSAVKSRDKLMVENGRAALQKHASRKK